MSMLAIVQNFIGQVSGAVNQKDNPLGLSAGQIDEINQILTLIKNLISDGIQRGDIKKMVVLMGEMMEHMPEMGAEIKEIIKGLKELSKKLFDDPNQTGVNKTNSVSKGLLGLEADVRMSQEVGEHGLLSDDDLIDTLSSQFPQSPDQIMVDKAILEETNEDRLELAEKILNVVNDQMVLSQTNFKALTDGLNKIKNRAALEGNLVDDHRVDGVSSSSLGG